MELLAAVLAVRTLTFIRKALTINYVVQTLWSDFKCVLSWIKTHKILPVFVQRRIDEIRAVPDLSFRYVPSVSNPADIPTRGSTLEELKTSIWWHGPAWLQEKENWPSVTYDFDEYDDEIYKSSEKPHITLPVIQKRYNSPFEIQLEKYSNYLRLFCVTKTALRFVQRSTKSRFPSFHLHNSPFTYAEFLWLRAEQAFHYADVFTALHQNWKHDIISKFNIFVDANGLLRCKHRLQHSNLPHNQKFPVLLPNAKDSNFVRLLIMYFHELTFHQGTAYTLTAIRREFWLPHGRANVSSTVMKCTRCKRFTSRPFTQPDDSAIPIFRLQENVTPFQSVGLDTCGLLYIDKKDTYSLSQI